MLPLLLAMPAPPAAVEVARPSSSAEDRLWVDLDRRLADPAAYRSLVDAQTGNFPEFRLFPYVLPVLALASRSRREGEDPVVLLARMETLLDLLVPEVARRLKVSGSDGIPGARGQGTWRGQLALALSAYRMAGGGDRYEALHAELCAVLLSELQARGGAPIDAYPGLVWGFDTIPVLLALRLRDRAVGLPGAEEAIQAHLRWVDEHLDPETSLPPSRFELDGGRIVEGPRGADLGLRITLMAQLDPARAAALYERFVQHFSTEVLGMEGFAEWPDGQSGRPDYDSGPVVLGLGMSSTGFGLGAARALGDRERFARMEPQLTRFPLLLAQSGPLVGPQLQALGMRLDTREFLTGLLLGDLSMLWGLSWEDWGAR